MLYGETMSLFDKFKRDKPNPEYCVVKIFKTHRQSDVINIKLCFDVMLNVFTSKGCILSGVTFNYGSMMRKKLSSVYKFMETRDVVYFYAEFNRESVNHYDSVGITYSNSLLNLTHKTDEKDYVDFILTIPFDWYSLELIKKVIKEIDAAIGLTYAYVCFLPKNYSIGSEKPLKVSFFSVSTTVNKDDIVLRDNLKNIDCGYIPPKKYPVNFYNVKQMECLNNDMDFLEKISDNLTLVTYSV